MMDYFLKKQINAPPPIALTFLNSFGPAEAPGEHPVLFPVMAPIYPNKEIVLL